MCSALSCLVLLTRTLRFDVIAYTHPSFALYVLFPMNTGPSHSPRDVLNSSCAWSRNWDLHLSANDIEAYTSRLTRAKRGRENKNQSLLASENFHSEDAYIHGVTVSAPCPDAAHEDLPPVTYVPSPSRSAGSHPAHSKPPLERHL